MARDKAVFATAVIIIIIAVSCILGLANFQAPSKVSGYNSNTLGTISINITGTLDITLIDANISFGNGAVSSGSSFAIIESTGRNATNGSWAATNDPFILENTGNVLVNLTIKAASSAADWIGGSSPAMKYNYTNNETSSCSQEGAFPSSAWATLPADPAVSGCCQALNYSNENDAIRVDLQLQVPVDAAAGYRYNAITFIAYQTA